MLLKNVRAEIYELVEELLGGNLYAEDSLDYNASAILEALQAAKHRDEDFRMQAEDVDNKENEIAELEGRIKAARDALDNC